MAVIDGQGITFTFNGVSVGGIVSYNVIDGITPDIEHKPTSATEPTFFPGLPQFGVITLNLMRDLADVGQIELESARAQSRKENCVLTLSDGSTRSFKGYVKKLPIVGSDNGLGTADAVIKIASAIS